MKKFLEKSKKWGRRKSRGLVQGGNTHAYFGNIGKRGIFW
ncbi:hypothetical protein BREVNS_1862 [Brevinematales bacterium NS]|jgi:hypothetical protein|nr:hypothetical protein BREVNS_1862 [Brevinematales bacterium NS]